MEREPLCVAIRTARKAKGLTQEQLAEILDITPNHMGQIETGTRLPSLKVLYHLAKTLNFSIDDAFFPENGSGMELRRKLERRLRECNESELHIIYATVDALVAQSDKTTNK